MLELAPFRVFLTCPVERVIVKRHLAEGKLHGTTHESVCRDTYKIKIQVNGSGRKKRPKHQLKHAEVLLRTGFKAWLITRYGQEATMRGDLQG